MTKWEYNGCAFPLTEESRDLYIGSDGVKLWDLAITAWLNSMAADGWELHGTVNTSQSTYPQAGAMFKRQKVE